MADRYFVMGQIYIEDVDSGIDVSGRKVADTAFTTTGAGTFKIYMASGCTGQVSGTGVSGGPVTLSAGLNTITVTGAVADGNIDITIGTAANWNTTASWSASSGGACTASVPTSSDATLFDANSFTAGSQVLTVDATASCLSMDWTGATNSPTFSIGSSKTTSVSGSITFIAAMTVTQIINSYLQMTDTGILTTNGITLSITGFRPNKNGGTITLGSDLTTTGLIQLYYGTFDTAGYDISCGAFGTQGYNPSSFTFGDSIITCTSFSMVGSTTITCGTSSMRITGTGAFTGNGKTYYEVQLNGTSHTVSGSNTFTNFIRNGTATKTDTLTLTAGTTQTITGVCSLIGNSATNRLLVQSSTLGTAATLDVDGAWTNTNAVDFMDITSTHAVDLSSLVTYDKYTGDCGGNTNITCSTVDTETLSATGSWSDVTKWTGGVTNRVPLPQDTVSAGGTGITITVDMPRIGASVTFTGTPTISLSNNINNYGSFTLPSGCTYTHNNKINYITARTNCSLTSNGKTIYELASSTPTATLSLTDDLINSYILVIVIGTFDANDHNVTSGYVYSYNYSWERTITMGNGIWTLNGTSALAKWNLYLGTVNINAEGSTLILTSSGTGGQTFNGMGKTYNNVTIQGSGAYTLTITGSNTFNTFTVDRSAAAKTITLTAGTIQTVADFVCATSGITTLTINSSTPGTHATLIITSGGKVIMNYVNVTDNEGTPTNTWFYGSNGSADAYSKANGWAASPDGAGISLANSLIAAGVIQDDDDNGLL